MKYQRNVFMVSPCQWFFLKYGFHFKVSITIHLYCVRNNFFFISLLSPVTTKTSMINISLIEINVTGNITVKSWSLMNPLYFQQWLEIMIFDELLNGWMNIIKQESDYMNCFLRSHCFMSKSGCYACGEKNIFVVTHIFMTIACGC